MFPKGSVIVVAYNRETQQPHWIEVAQNFGPIKGYGWLIDTTEGNTVLVNGSEKYVASAIFAVDERHINALKWLVKHPKTQSNLDGFTKYLKKNLGKALLLDDLTLESMSKEIDQYIIDKHTIASSKSSPLTFENLMKAMEQIKHMKPSKSYHDWYTQFLTDPSAWFVGIDHASLMTVEMFLKSENSKLTSEQLKDFLNEGFFFLDDSKLPDFHWREDEDDI